MPSTIIKATEMKSAKVSHISLVKAGANRAPFKVIKEEKSMSALDIDLASVFKSAKKVSPVLLTGVVTMKSENMEAKSEAFKAAGIVVDNAKELEDGSVVFAQVAEEAMKGESSIIRLSDDACIVMKGFRPYMSDMSIAEGTPFADVCQAQGFYPGVGTMVDVLRSSVMQLAEKSEDQPSTLTAVAKMFDEAKQYALSLIGALPVAAFKLENMPAMEVASKGEKEEPSTPDTEDGSGSGDGGEGVDGLSDEEVSKADLSVVPVGVKADVWAKMPPFAKMKWLKDNATTTAATKAVTPDLSAVPKGVAADVWAGMDDAAKIKWLKDNSMKPVVKSEAPAFDIAAFSEVMAAQIQKSVDGLQTAIKKDIEVLTTTVAKTGDDIGKLGERIDATEKVAKAAHDAVEGTVVSGSESGDPQQVVRKSEAGRDIDTAFTPRRRAAGR